MYSNNLRKFIFLNVQWEYNTPQYKKNCKNETPTEVYRTKCILNPPIKDP